jgi:hypothetical protein
MPRLSKVALLLVVMLAVSVGALAQTPAPNPEMKDFQLGVGKWLYQGERRTSPEGPWDKESMPYESRALGGFFFEGHFAFVGGASGTEVFGFDPKDRTRLYIGFSDRGTLTRGTWEWSGDRTLMFGGTETSPDGREGQWRCTWKVAADGRSADITCEVLTDGKWWLARKAKGTKQ